MLLSMGPCPYCCGGNNTPCFATFDDGYKCYTCSRSKSQGADYNAWIPRSTKKAEFYIPEHTNDPGQFSPEALEWLYKYFIFSDTIKQYRIGYIQDTNSLLMPVFDGAGKLVFAQIRKLSSKEFLTKGSKESLFICTPGNSPDKWPDKSLVIVEDYISAIRVGKHRDCLCLFGTTLNKSSMTRLINQYTNFIVWLDGDIPGQTAAQSITDALSAALEKHAQAQAFSIIEPRTIDTRRTTKDPKCYTDNKIKLIVENNIDIN